MDGYTNFTKVHAEVIHGDEIAGPVTGGVNSSNSLSKAIDYALSASEKNKFFTSIAMTAENKTLTLGLDVGQSMIVYNKGANSVTVKNIADDTGTALVTTKALLVVGGVTSSADQSIVIALN